MAFMLDEASGIVYVTVIRSLRSLAYIYPFDFPLNMIVLKMYKLERNVT